MKIHLQAGLPYVQADVVYRGQALTLNNVLLDTGSAGTIFAINHMQTIGLQYEPDDPIHRIRGVGGSEFVFTKRIDQLALQTLSVTTFEVEIGALDYGFAIDGILGMDFLMRVGAVVDLARLEIHPVG